jgi:hypothetical protein
MGRYVAAQPLCIAWIWLVTCYDVYCCRLLEPPHELNPLAALILVHWGVWALVSLKVFGTFLATEWLRRLPMCFTWVITILMTLLLGVLTLC